MCLGDRELSDDRILGSGEFVERIIKEAEAKIKYQLPVKKDDQKFVANNFSPTRYFTMGYFPHCRVARRPAI